MFPASDKRLFATRSHSVIKSISVWQQSGVHQSGYFNLGRPGVEFGPKFYAQSNMTKGTEAGMAGKDGNTIDKKKGEINPSNSGYLWLTKCLMQRWS